MAKRIFGNLSLDFIKSEIDKYTLSLQDWFNDNPAEHIKRQQEAKDWLWKTVEAMIANYQKEIYDYTIYMPGYFYMFNYFSELYAKKKLDVVDAFPLIFVIEKSKKGFLGLNFHWIHIKYRAIILLELMRAMPDKFVSDTLLYPMNYSMIMKIIKAHGLQRYIKLAIRFYKWENVMYMKGLYYCRIPNTEMVDAIKYVSPRYIGMTPTEVIRKVRESMFTAT